MSLSYHDRKKAIEEKRYEQESRYDLDTLIDLIIETPGKTIYQLSVLATKENLTSLFAEGSTKCSREVMWAAIDDLTFRDPKLYSEYKKTPQGEKELLFYEATTINL